MCIKRLGCSTWFASAGALAATCCLAGALLLALAGLRLPRPRASHYVVNACLTFPSPGAPQIGLGWRAPRLASSVGWQPFGRIRTHRNALCGALPWAAFLPREGVVLLPFGGVRAGPPIQPAGPPG